MSEQSPEITDITDELIAERRGDDLSHLPDDMPNWMAFLIRWIDTMNLWVGPLDFTREAFVRECIIRKFAECYTTSQVVDALVNVQEQVIEKKCHLTRDQIREQIRTMNPNNKKFNRAKWGDFYEECNQEYVANLHSKIHKATDRFSDCIMQALENAKVEITSVNDLRELLTMTQSLSAFALARIDSPDIAAAILQLRGSIAQLAEENHPSLPSPSKEEGDDVAALIPGTNGHTKALETSSNN